MILENFDGPRFDERLSWFNEPSRWEIRSGVGLWVATEGNTDFWRRTHYGFEADSGHCLFARFEGDFAMSTRVVFHPRHQYDQAGLMVRFSADGWLKTSVEYEPVGPSRLGCVVTNGGYSDWSTQDFPRERREVELRVRRVGADFHVEFRDDTRDSWSQMRVAHLVEGETSPSARCGLYACSPKDGGFEAEFRELRIEGGGRIRQ